MPRHPPSTPGYPRPLVAAIVILLALSLLPSRWTGLVTQIDTVARYLVAPVSGPVTRVARWLLPPRGPQGIDAEGLARLEADASHWKALYLQALARNEELQRQNQELAGHRQLPGELPVDLVRARIVGGSPDPAAGLLLVRAGKAQGVEVNTIAVVGGSQLAGRVERVDQLTSEVRLITSTKVKEVIPAVICVGDDPSEWLECNLYRQPGGVLRGPFKHNAKLASRVAVGNEVRLTDASSVWPSSGRLLLVGTVVEVQNSAGDQVRYVVVRPTVDRLELVSELILRVPAPEAVAGAGGGGGGGDSR